ncbi:hypothetical protein ACOTBX_03120 [Achromobacter xylosoxidans]
MLYNVVEINPACLRLVGPTENVRGLGIVMTIMRWPCKANFPI